MMFMRLSLFVFLVACTLVSSATTRKVFFVGNSYTYTNSMPDMLRDFAAAKGDTLVYAMSAPGGYTFQQHTTLGATLTGIASQPWDIVVLQEQSQIPSFPPAQVATDCYPYAARLDSFIDENDSCIETMFMMTWGRRNGDAMNCPGYPVVCTYNGMQARLRDSYMEMAADNHASVAPMGSAWKIVIDSFPAIDLYQPDSSHPSVAGSYLQACVFYASIFHRPAMGCTYLGGLSGTTAATLQRIADKVVLDSLSQWQQHGHYPYARYNVASTSGMDVTFSNASQRATSYTWVFGDGATSTVASPSHTYAASGVYTVSLTASNECKSEVYSQAIHVGVTGGVGQVVQQDWGIQIMNTGNGVVRFLCSKNSPCSTLQVYDAAGKKLLSNSVECDNAEVHLAPGVYVLRALSSDGRMVVTRFSVY